MIEKHDIWIERRQTITLAEPVAIVGSPGLRSIGKLVVENLVSETKAELIAELYSSHMPSIYQTAPSYAADPSNPGVSGVLVESAKADLPKIRFYSCSIPELILVEGYHPNFQGQYRIAEEVVNLLVEHHVKRMIIVAGYGAKVKNVICAANNLQSIKEMKDEHNIGLGYQGPFMGFSGLVFGLAGKSSIPALTLFASTTPTEADLEFPDKEASERILEKLRVILELTSKASAIAPT